MLNREYDFKNQVLHSNDFSIPKKIVGPYAIRYTVSRRMRSKKNCRLQSKHRGKEVGLVKSIVNIFMTAVA